MTIKDILTREGLSMKALSDRFEIPYRTVQNWCAAGKEHRDCPEYVVKMIDRIIRIEHIVKDQE